MRILRRDGLAVLLALSLGLASSAAAEDTSKPWHRWGHYTLAIGAGMSHYSEFRNTHDDGSLSSVRLEENDDCFHAAIGFAGRYLGLEVGYETLGRVRMDATSDGSGNLWFPGRMNARLEGSAVSASGLFRAPAGSRWVSQLRAGLFNWRATERTSGSNGLLQTREKSTSTSLVIGLGGEFQLDRADRVWAHAEVTRSEVGERDVAHYAVTGSVVLHY